MPTPDFRFKQFAINHDRCAMKVNTDGVLLGAWAVLNKASKIVDIGTGTGLIGLMLAQRCQHLTPPVSVTAIEIDKFAAQQAAENALASPWSSQVRVVEQDIQSFSRESQDKFDTIVSNPPYFSNALAAPDLARNKARHNDGLSFAELLQSAANIASTQCLFTLILPCNEAERLLSIAAEHHWHLAKHCLVATVEGKTPSRSLLTLSTDPFVEAQTSQLTIRNKDNSYHPDFINLCRDFYLFM